MNRMTTLHEKYRYGRGKKPVRTNGAIRFQRPLNTGMIVCLLVMETNIAFDAVKKVALFAAAADATFVAVEDVAIRKVIEKFAKSAIVARHDFLALWISAQLRNRLQLEAVHTEHFRNSEAVNFVVRIFVMAQSAGINFGAAWCLDFATSAIMRATKFFLLFVKERGDAVVLWNMSTHWRQMSSSSLHHNFLNFSMLFLHRQRLVAVYSPDEILFFFIPKSYVINRFRRL